MKKHVIVYQFNSSKFGFQNQITVEANNTEQAILKAKNECSQCYGNRMINRFSFQNPESKLWIKSSNIK